MEIDLCWYQKGTNNTQTCNLKNHLLEDLETMITLASMTYVLDGYELHPGDEKIFKDFTMNARVLHCTYDRGLL